MLNINKLSGVPVYEQIVGQMMKLIISGILKPEEQIPSVRSLSLELSINPNTIQKAYGELELRGITSSVPGVGRFVSKDAKALIKKYYTEKMGELKEKILDLALAEVDEEDVVSMVREAYNTVNNGKEKGKTN